MFSGISLGMLILIAAIVILLIIFKKLKAAIFLLIFGLLVYWLWNWGILRDFYAFWKNLFHTMFN